MTLRFRAHFDGKVLVPEGHIDLPRDESLVVAIENPFATAELSRSTLAFLLNKRRGRGISDEDAQRMKLAIENARERVSL